MNHKPIKDQIINLETKNLKEKVEEKPQIKGVDSTEKMKEDFTKFILSHLKRDGQRARAKDSHIRNIIMKLMSHEIENLKNKAKKKVKLNILTEIENMFNAFLEEKDFKE